MADVIKDVLMGKLFGTSGTSSGGGSSSAVTYYVEDITPSEDADMASSNNAIFTSYVMDVDNAPSVIIAYSNLNETTKASSSSGYMVNIAVKSGEPYSNGGQKYQDYNAKAWLYNKGSSQHLAPLLGSFGVKNGNNIPYVYQGANALVRAGVTYRAILFWGVEL